MDRLYSLRDETIIAWDGLALDDSPLLLRSRGAMEVYTLQSDVP